MEYSNQINRKKLDHSEITVIRTDLELNPPLNPDYKRIVNFYSAKLQYAELHFSGQNFQSQSVKIPPALLPYRNEEVRNRLTTSLKMFETLKETSEYQDFKEVEIEKKRITDKYLTPIKTRKGKSILKITDKNSFTKEVLKLQNILQYKSKKLYQVLFNEIEISKNNIKETLIEFLIANPTEDMILMGSANYSIMATNITNGLINQLMFPDPLSIIKKFKLEMNFSDITSEDLKDKEMLSELKEKNIIDQADEKFLADFGKGISLQE